MIDVNLKRNDFYLVRFCVLYFIMEAANLFVKLYLGGMAIWGLLSKGILFLALIPAIIVTVRRKKSSCIFVMLEIFLFWLLLLTWLRGTAGYAFWKNSVYILGIYLPLGCCVGAISDKEALLENLYRVRLMPQIMLLVTLTAFKDGIYDYNMSTSYALLFWALVTADHLFNVSRKKIDIFLLLLDAVLIFFKGSRGALLCFAAYVFLTFIIGKKGIYPIKIFMGIMGLGGIAVVILLNRLLIFKVIYDWMIAHGYQSRIMWSLAYNLFYDSGRSSIYQSYMELISPKVMLGYGLLGGRQAGMPIAHNMVLETMFYFGVPLSVIFLIWFFVMLFRMCNLSRNNSEARVIIITFSVLVSTLFSNELFLCPFFYIGIAMICSRKETEYRLEDASIE